MSKKKLILSGEHAGRLNDILADYEAMIVTANNTIKEMREQWEDMFKGMDSGDDRFKDLTEQLDRLKIDEGHIKVAEQRYRELQKIVWDFMGIVPTENVTENNDEGSGEGIDLAGNNEVQSATEDEETVLQE